MTKEYTVILLFLLFSFVIGFVNKVGSPLAYLWAVLYLLYLALGTITTLIITTKLVMPFRAYEAQEIERIAMNLLIMGLITTAPWLAKEAGYQTMRLWKRRTGS